MSSAKALLRVLYVEDNVRDAKLCSKQLEKAGFELSADIVSSPEEFVKALRSKTYDVILADYKLPGWSGAEVLETLQREGNEIPLILVTGTVGEETAVEAIKKGATDYVLKDRPARLPFAIDRALDEKRVREDQKRVEQTRELLASLVESSDDAIIGATREGIIASWNRGAEHIFRYSAEEAQGRPISILFAANRTPEFAAVIETLGRGENISRHEALGVKRGGALIDVAVTISPIRSADGTVAGASVIARDITENKRIEAKLIRINDELRQFAYAAAHDLQEPLRTVGLCCQMVVERRKNFLDSEAAQFLNRGIDAAQRMQTLLRDLLSYTEAVDTDAEPTQPVDCNGIVRAVLKNLELALHECQAKVAIGELPTVQAFPAHLHQVFQNLLGNALKYRSQERQPEIRIGAEERRGEVVFSVQDNGIGIDPEYHGRIFGVFKRLHGRSIPGNGVGLAICRRIVDHYGGRIWLESEVNRGSTFHFSLPLEIVKDAAWVNRANV